MPSAWCGVFHSAPIDRLQYINQIPSISEFDGECLIERCQWLLYSSTVRIFSIKISSPTYSQFDYSCVRCQLESLHARWTTSDIRRHLRFVLFWLPRRLSFQDLWSISAASRLPILCTRFSRIGNDLLLIVYIGQYWLEWEKNKIKINTNLCAKRVLRSKC